MKVVIVGGVAGGASAAARLRRLDEEAEIIIIERTGYISYANCGLPYFVSGDIANKKKLTLQTPESFKRRFNVEVRVLNEVTAIDPSAKSIMVKDLKDGTEYEENYDKLLLATGARPIVQNIPGAECNRVFSMQTVEDALALEAFISAGMPKNAVIAGGGYVGLEMAECLTKRGISVKMVHRSEQLMKTLDYDMACEIKSYLKKQCVEIMTGTPLESVTESEGKLFVTAGGKSIPTDMVLLALGTVPSTKLAADAGLKLGVKNAVLVDKHMRTSDPDIYAVGDAVQTKNLVSGKDAVIPLAGPANRQGRLAADNICGIRTEYNGASGASVFKLFDMTVAAVGLTESEAENAGIPYESVVLPSSSHAAYYPGASSMTVKAVFV